MDWKNLEKDQISFGTVLKIWQKNTCRRAFLETWQAAKFPCILRKWLILKKKKKIRHVQKYSFFV